MKIFLSIKFKYNSFVVGGLLILLLSSLNLSAQTNEQSLINLYRNHQFNLIKQKLSEFAPQDTSGMTYLFFKTLFIRNGALAKKNYERVYRYASNPLKKLAAQRLHDYYYALGLYFKASQYSGIQPDSQKTGHPIKSDDLFYEGSLFKIQFGAFSSKKNAEQQARFLQKENIQAKVVKRRINNRQLYCVWVNGLKNIEETQKFAEQIKKQVHLDYRIIKP